MCASEHQSVILINDNRERAEYIDSSVTDAVGKLQEAGLIRCGRGPDCRSRSLARIGVKTLPLLH